MVHRPLCYSLPHGSQPLLSLQQIHRAILCPMVHRPSLFPSSQQQIHSATLCPMVHRPLCYSLPHGSQTFFAPLLSRMSWSMDWRMTPLIWAEPLLICFWMVSDTSRKQFHACRCVWVWEWVCECVCVSVYIGIWGEAPTSHTPSLLPPPLLSPLPLPCTRSTQRPVSPPHAF